MSKKRYLVRAGFNPIAMTKEKPENWIWKSYVGGNSGNLMFAYGVMNALTTPETELSYTYKNHWSDEEIEWINQNFDAVILPLADAFRIGFTDALRGLTDMVKRVNVPVIVIGVGLRADYDVDFKTAFPFDDLVKEFVSEVLKKSGIIGLRGELTGQYLKSLGFTEGEDYTVIGCPSFYTYGNSIHTHAPKQVNHIAMNTNDYYNIGFINQFFCNTVDAMPDCSLIQQVRMEYTELYMGVHWIPGAIQRKKMGTPPSLLGPARLKRLKKEDRVKYFFDNLSWMNYLKGYDLFVGDRIHGCIAATLAGIPTVMIPFNARTRELTEYHHLACLTPEQIRQDTSILDYLSEIDFTACEKQHPKNFEHYVDFLNKSGLEHIFKEKSDWQMGESYLEKAIQESLSCDIHDFCREVHTYDSLSFSEKLGRRMRVNRKFFNKK